MPSPNAMWRVARWRGPSSPRSGMIARAETTKSAVWFCHAGHVAPTRTRIGTKHEQPVEAKASASGDVCGRGGTCAGGEAAAACKSSGKRLGSGHDSPGQISRSGNGSGQKPDLHRRRLAGVRFSWPSRTKNGAMVWFVGGKDDRSASCARDGGADFRRVIEEILKMIPLQREERCMARACESWRCAACHAAARVSPKLSAVLEDFSRTR